MKTRGLQRVERGRQRSLDHRGVRTDKSPPVAGEYAYPEAAQCVGCGAVYLRKTWRRSAPRRLGAYLLGTERVSCPACRQVGEGRGYGRVLLQGAGLADREDEVRRRIAAVESRARFSQPERRLVEIVRRGERLEVVTTSQKLAHRVARELEKAFGGETSYAWSDRDGSLRATWSIPRSGADTENPAPRKRRPSS
jgi:NMD protein affecting ribosome stability and mRNA decay